MTTITAGQLFRMNPGLACVDCGKQVADAPAGEVWVKHNGMYRCPRCARYENLY